MIEVQQPNLIITYNQNMGGVDLQDQMIARYSITFRSKKYYQKMIFHPIDMAIMNAWLLYRKNATNLVIQ